MVSLLAVGQTPLAADEPRYAGRTLSECQALMGQLELRDPGTRVHVPWLIELIDSPAVPWVSRRQAALTLGRLGPLATAAVPHLVKLLTDVSGDDPEASPQRWALSALALFGPEAFAATPDLIRLLRADSNSVTTRLGCLEALSQIGPAHPAALPAIRRELERGLPASATEEDREVALGAAEALGMAGSAAASSVPVLMRAAQHADEHLRRESLRALGRIGSAARDAQVLLADVMVSDSSPLVRDTAATSLGQTGSTAWPLIEPILAGVEIETRLRALSALAGWRDAQQAIRPALMPLLCDGEAAVRLAAAKSWRALTEEPDAVWEIFVELLTAADRDVRRGASRELQSMMSAGQIDEKLLGSLERDPRPQVSREAVRLRRIQRAVVR